jgi:hypothetical protein
MVPSSMKIDETNVKNDEKVITVYDLSINSH